MINIRTLRKLENNDGLTLKNGKVTTYKTGYQVATEYKGNCGVWFAEGIYYIDKSHRENTKKKALEVGRNHNQISILQWGTMNLIYC